MAPVVNAVIENGEGIIEGAFTAAGSTKLRHFAAFRALPVPLEVRIPAKSGPPWVKNRSKAVFVPALPEQSPYSCSCLPTIGCRVWQPISHLQYTLHSWPRSFCLRATLTLPGNRRLVLSIGMAVDANVIIFERVKEELRSGKRLRIGIRDGGDTLFPRFSIQI